MPCPTIRSRRIERSGVRGAGKESLSGILGVVGGKSPSAGEGINRIPVALAELLQRVLPLLISGI